VRNRFVQTENVRRFLSAVKTLEGRGAPEACMVLATGDAAHGKTRCGAWYANQTDAILIRIKSAATPHWFLTDLVRACGESKPAHSSEKLFAQALQHLVPNPRPIVIDEVENAVRDIKVIETIRDVSDACETPVILLGREHVVGRLKRERQVWSRIQARAEFQRCSLEDVRLAAETLCEVPVGEDVLARVLEDSEGYIREIVSALAHVERIGLRNKGASVTSAMVQDKTLVRDHQRQGRAAA
jgi:hypothetical protein